MNKISGYRLAGINYVRRNNTQQPIQQQPLANNAVGKSVVSFGNRNSLFQFVRSLIRPFNRIPQKTANKGSRRNIVVFATEHLNNIIESSTKLIKNGTATPDTYITRARAFAGMEKFEEASKDIATALAAETNPGKIKIFENLQRTIKEIEEINQKIKDNPLEMKTLIVDRAGLYRTLSKEKAFVDYHWASVFWEFEERSVTRSRKLAEIFSKMGDISMEQDTPDVDTAISCYRKVIKLNPNDVRAQKTFNWLNSISDM